MVDFYMSSHKYKSLAYSYFVCVACNYSILSITVYCHLAAFLPVQSIQILLRIWMDCSYWQKTANMHDNLITLECVIASIAWGKLAATWYQFLKLSIVLIYWSWQYSSLLGCRLIASYQALFLPDNHIKCNSVIVVILLLNCLPVPFSASCFCLAYHMFLTRY